MFDDKDNRLMVLWCVTGACAIMLWLVAVRLLIVEDRLAALAWEFYREPVVVPSSDDDAAA